MIPGMNENVKGPFNTLFLTLDPRKYQINLVKTKLQNRVTGLPISLQVETKLQNRVTGFLTKICFGKHEVRAMIVNQSRSSSLIRTAIKQIASC